MSNNKTLNGNELFNTSRRLKGGNEAVHKIFWITIGTNPILKNKLNYLTAEWKKKNVPASSRLPLISSIQESANINRRKATKAKKIRYEVNCRQLIKTITPNHGDGDEEPISRFELHTESICSIWRRQLPYMKYAYDKGIFSIAAREVITQYLPELLPAGDDDGGNDNSGDENDDKDYIGDCAKSIDEDRDDEAGESSESWFRWRFL